MESIVNGNADLLFRNKELIDSLTKEAASLRESEICLAKAFSELPKELATAEVFELFMRDIHMAHQELSLRLQNLIQSQAGKEVANANNNVENLKSQLKNAQDRIKTLNNELEQEKERTNRLNQDLAKEQKKHKETQTAYQQYQQLVQEKARHIKSEYLEKINNDNEWTTYGSTFEVMNQLIDWQVGDLENAKNALGDSSQKGLWNINDKINEVIDTLWLGVLVRGTLVDARNMLVNFANSYPEGKNHIEQAQDKIVPLKARVDKENSSLSKLLSELNTICNELSGE